MTCGGLAYFLCPLQIQKPKVAWQSCVQAHCSKSTWQWCLPPALRPPNLCCFSCDSHQNLWQEELKGLGKRGPLLLLLSSFLAMAVSPKGRGGPGLPQKSDHCPLPWGPSAPKSPLLCSPLALLGFILALLLFCFCFDFLLGWALTFQLEREKSGDISCAI